MISILGDETVLADNEERPDIWQLLQATAEPIETILANLELDQSSYDDDLMEMTDVSKHNSVESN